MMLKRCSRSHRQTYDDFEKPTLQKGLSGAADDVSSTESLHEYQPPPPRLIDRYVKAEIPCLSKRATVAFLCCLGFIIMFGMRETMGMIKTRLKPHHNGTHSKNSTSSSKEGGTDSDALVDAAVFWGYFVTQVPGGLIAAAYPANKLFGAAIGSSCVLNFFIPFVYGMQSRMPMIIIRVLQGLVEGVTYPACHGIMSQWAPPLERSRLATIAFSGCYAGVMFSMTISAVLMENISFLAPFYFYSTVGICWWLVWIWLVFEKPTLHTCIEPKELIYIESSLGGSSRDLHYVKPNLTNTPWKAFFTSLPCYAIFVANFCRSWNFYLLVLFQAEYFQEAFSSSMAELAVWGPIPHLLMTLIVPAGGILADRLRQKGILTTTQVRKLFNCGGFGMEATFFIIMAYSKTLNQGMTALTLGVAFSGFAISGFNVNHLDIAPRYASILMGMSNGIGTLAGAIIPVVKGKFVPKQDATKEDWRILIITSAFVHYAGIIFYGIFASGELQAWADPKLVEEKQWNQMTENYPVKGHPNQSNGLLQRQPSGGVTNYGAVVTPNYDHSTAPLTKTGSQDVPQRPPRPARILPQEPQMEQSSFSYPAQQCPPAVIPAGNPFATSSRNPFRQEPVQPAAQDTYLHGSISDRTY